MLVASQEEEQPEDPQVCFLPASCHVVPSAISEYCQQEAISRHGFLSLQNCELNKSLSFIKSLSLQRSVTLTKKWTSGAHGHPFPSGALAVLGVDGLLLYHLDTLLPAAPHPGSPRNCDF
jgi:hypothetical protein